MQWPDVHCVSLPQAAPLPSGELPLHTPAEHVPAEQLSVCAAGHEAELPEQLADSVAVVPEQLPARHCVAEDAKPSAGHEVELPVQLSTKSHAPAEARQTVVEGAAEQVPRRPVTLHAWQSLPEPLPQLLLQQ